ncbi:MAG: hypothetical protein LBQ57_08215 [Spirochaetales bacterium]|jgi:hypothetical protein|nr:hypothetical protein [Spirochaetales bacterium]
MTSNITNTGLVFFLLLVLPPFFALSQDCCAPGGAGLAVQLVEKGEYHLKFPRRYQTRKHHLGIDLGTEAGFEESTEKNVADITTRLEYNGLLGDLDMYGAFFYTASFDNPAARQLDAAENIAYTLNRPGVSALTFRLDNEDILTLSPENPAFGYGALEPGVLYGKQFDFGGLSAETGLPLGYEPDFRLGSYFTLGYEHSSGFKAGISANFAIKPDKAYAATVLTLTYDHELFYAAIAIRTDKEFKTYGIRPYTEFFIRRFTLWTGADFGGLGTDKIAISPFAGGKYNF